MIVVKVSILAACVRLPPPLPQAIADAHHRPLLISLTSLFVWQVNEDFGVLIFNHLSYHISHNQLHTHQNKIWFGIWRCIA